MIGGRSAGEPSMKKFLIGSLAVSAVLVAANIAWADHTSSCPPGSRHPGGAWDRAHGGILSRALHNATGAKQSTATRAIGQATLKASGVSTTVVNGQIQTVRDRIQHKVKR